MRYLMVTKTIPAGSTIGQAVSSEGFTHGSFQLPAEFNVRVDEEEESSSSESSPSSISESSQSTSESSLTSSSSSSSSLSSQSTSSQSASSQSTSSSSESSLSSESSQSESSQSLSSQSTSSQSTSSSSSSGEVATITWQVTNDGTNWVTPKEADGTTDAVSVVADITVLGCYRLPAELFDFKCFRPVCGVMQYDARTITYFLGG